jgi:hypothetical protein
MVTCVMYETETKKETKRKDKEGHIQKDKQDTFII